ncbi:MAG: molecular chaperone TorD family protein [Syntrophales bacterium LBB04]|nr:molecular chaperone TorD family protein [Syntrophales bacterium LBB04]
MKAGLPITLYSLLAQGLNYPDNDLIADLVEGDFIAALKETLDAAGRPGDITKDLSDYYSRPGADQKELLLELERDYTWMFFASKPRVAYLFESVYSEGKLYQEATFEVARLYHEAGLKLDEAFKLPPDHIAVEFEFMTYLSFQEIEALKADDRERADYARDLQTKVIEKHLRPFALELAQRMEPKAKTLFYRTMAGVLKNVLREG